MDKVIITAAITGAELSKEHNPALPCSPEEQAKAAYECFNAGASIIHLHVRDEKEKPSQELSLFETVVKKIKEKCNVLIQFSTGGAVGEKIENRMAPLSLKPEMASLNVGSINFGEEVFKNLPQDINKLAAKMKEYHIKPEIEVYDIGMLEYGISLVKNGIVDVPAHFQFVMGTKYGIQASPENLSFMQKKIPSNCTWNFAGIGRHQYGLAGEAIDLGGHIRCGLEDNIYYTKGVLAKSNGELVERIANLVKEKGKKVASVEEAKNILSI